MAKRMRNEERDSAESDTDQEKEKLRTKVDRLRGKRKHYEKEAIEWERRAKRAEDWISRIEVRATKLESEKEEIQNELDNAKEKLTKVVDYHDNLAKLRKATEKRFTAWVPRATPIGQDDVDACIGALCQLEQAVMHAVCHREE